LDYDAIVIGSGMGGLSAASLLTQLYGRKVLILEKHSRPGGFTHSFSRQGKFEWDVGVHYVGDMAPGSVLRKVMDRVTGSAVSWRKFRDPFQRFFYPGFTLEMPGDPKAYEETLLQMFPDERQGIERYFKLTRQALTWERSRLIMSSLAPSWFRRLARWALAKRADLAYQSTRDFLSGLSPSRELQCILDAQWGTYGIPPAQSPMLWNAMIFWHYARGAYYPLGGAGELAKAAVGIVQAGGGDVLLQSEVIEVLISDGAAHGVRVRSIRSGETTEYRSPLIISDIGARATYAKFLKNHPSQTREDVAAAPMASSTVTVYLGLKESPEKIGIHGENLWIADGIDHDRSWEERNHAFEGKPVMAFVSFASQNGFMLKGHTAQIVAPMDYELFAPWAGKGWRQRGEDYERRKALIAEGLIAFVDKRVPGLRDLIAYSEVSTPLTIEHFTSHPMGQIYGIPAVLGRKEWAWISPETPLKGLYLTGADVIAGGVTAAMLGGVITLARIFGFSVFRKVFF